MNIEDSMTNEDLYVLLCKYYVDKKWRVQKSVLTPEESSLLPLTSDEDKKLFIAVDSYLERQIGKSEVTISERMAYLISVTSGRKV